MSEDTRYDLNWIVSVDDHIIEPPNVWQDRLPAKYKDVGAPGHRRRQTAASTGPTRTSGMATGGLGASAGRRPEDITAVGFPYTRDAARLLRPQGPAARHERRRDPGLAQLPVLPPVLRPDVLGGQGQGPGPPLRQGLQRLDDRRVVRRRSRPATSPSAIIPLWDPAAGGQGDRAHQRQGLPTRSASRRTSSRSACPTIHTGALGPGPPGGQRHCRWCCPSTSGRRRPSTRSPRTRRSWPTSHSGMIRPDGRACMDWIFSGLFQRFPNIKIALSEGSIGWIPWVLERAEQVYDHPAPLGRQGPEPRATSGPGAGLRPRTSTPRRSTSTGTTGSTSTAASSTTRTGLGMLDVVGEDNVMIEIGLPPLRHDLAPLDQAGPRAARRRRPVRRGQVQDPAGQRRAAVPVHPGRGARQRHPPLSTRRVAARRR